MSKARPGVLHQYTSKLTAFEHTPNPLGTSQNIILFVGGLFDGFLTVPYTTPLASSLPRTWSLAQVLLSSSYSQWGFSSLQKDVEELSKCVSYFRSIIPGKIVLMGHSTGCQDVMEYLTGEGYDERAPVDGGILQASVSDREAIVSQAPKEYYDLCCELAQKMVDEENGHGIMPPKFSSAMFETTAPISANRFLSLASPKHDGDDDYFSSDLSDEQLLKSFGNLPERSPLLILYGGVDEYVPKSVDKKGLVDRWIGAVNKGKGKVDETHSGIVEDGSHNLSGNEESEKDMIRRVVGFVSGLDEQANL